MKRRRPQYPKGIRSPTAAVARGVGCPISRRPSADLRTSHRHVGCCRQMGDQRSGGLSAKMRLCGQSAAFMVPGFACQFARQRAEFLRGRHHALVAKLRVVVRPRPYDGLIIDPSSPAHPLPPASGRESSYLVVAPRFRERRQADGGDNTERLEPVFHRVRCGALTPVPSLWTVSVPFPCDRGSGPISACQSVGSQKSAETTEPPEECLDRSTRTPGGRSDRDVQGEVGHRQPQRPRPDFP